MRSVKMEMSRGQNVCELISCEMVPVLGTVEQPSTDR